MIAYFDIVSDEVSAVCPKCGERITCPLDPINIGTTITLWCTGCGADLNNVLVVGPRSRDGVDPEMVNHPSHYQSETGMEVIDVIEAFTFDLKGIEAFDTGNVIKYICRWKQKNGLEDLEKAKWYINDLIDHVKKSEEENRPHD
jgi:hypothetical protein